VQVVKQSDSGLRSLWLLVHVPSDSAGFHSRLVMEARFEGNMGESMDDVESRIKELVAKSKNLPVTDVRMDSTFDELQIDSLDKINLSFEVEEMFAIEIPDDSLNSLKTVGDVVRGVEMLRAAAPADSAAS
jgi:acyl carrier protein